MSQIPEIFPDWIKIHKRKNSLEAISIYNKWHNLVQSNRSFSGYKMSCLFLPAKKNIQKKILVPVCFMLHSTILKQKQKDKKIYTEGRDSVVIIESVKP